MGFYIFLKRHNSFFYNRSACIPIIKRKKHEQVIVLMSKYGVSFSQNIKSVLWLIDFKVHDSSLIPTHIVASAAGYRMVEIKRPPCLTLREWAYKLFVKVLNSRMQKPLWTKFVSDLGSKFWFVTVFFLFLQCLLAL